MTVWLDGVAETAKSGVGVTLKLPALGALPVGVVTVIGPLVAPDGTFAVIWVALLTVKLAFAPLNATVVAPVKLVPVIVTLVPLGPLVGVKPPTVGGAGAAKPRAQLLVAFDHSCCT